MAKLCKLKSKEFKAHRNSVEFKRLKKEVAIEKKACNARKIEEAVKCTGGTHAWMRKVQCLSQG